MTAWVALLFPAAAFAQEAGARPRTDCPAATAVLGPQTPQQARAELRRVYASERDRTYLHPVTEEFLQATGYSALVSWPGKGLPESIAAQLDVSVPKDLLKEPVTAADTLVAILDDSVHLALGEPRPATLQSARVPRFIPLSVALTTSSFVALAKASRLTLTFRGRTFKAPGKVVASLNALFRAMTCAQEAAF
jgi:hypothetical protein